MPKVGKKYRLVNGKRTRRRNMSLKQIMHFGTKRQRAAAKARMHNTRKVKRRSYSRVSNKSTRRRSTRRVGNVGEILTLLPANPGARRRRRKTTKASSKRRKNTSMATKAQRRALAKARAARRRYAKGGRASNPHRRRRRRRSNPVARRHRRRSNPIMHYRRRRRRSNPGGYRRRYHRRRNPGFMSGTAGKVVGVIGGAAVTSFLSGMLPSSFQSGIMGYIATSVVAVVQGKAFGKILKSSATGNDMMIGGFTYVAMKVLADYFPSLAAYSPFKLGLIGPSSFYVPQVNKPGSMGTFVTPAAIPAPVVVQSGSMHGMGATRRVGRMR